uniref:S-layer y domain-containing protein n=1 Tax=uncultured bacterium Contig160 TaxID=1393469 RepID=W0FN32_9BACT|nr:S-layer y domain-containing protein [uncultured bacterium Contig160]
MNFKEVDGVNESSIDGMKVSTGLTSGEYHWYRLEKAGTTYTGYLSEDGEEFQKVFTYEDTDIDASMIVIDAYSGRSVGYQYWLQSLTIEKEYSICSHEYVDEVINPTCTERGYTVHTCTKCGRSYNSDYVDALGHDFGEYTKTKDFTETERGELTSYCSRCDATRTRPIAAGNEKPHKNEILFISDVHSAKRAENGFHNLRALFGLLKSEDNFIPEVVGGGGDYIESSTNDNADWPHAYQVLHDIIYEGAPDTFQALGSGNHEWEWSQQSEEMIEKLLGQPRVCNSYNSDDFAIFHIGAHMNGTGQEEFKTEDIEKLHTFLDTQVGNGKVIFVQTHWPLHYAYNWAWRTTKNAGQMIDLLNEYSEKMDICFVWGHNHHQDAHRHMFYGRNDVLQISATEYKRIKFNYLNAGCLNENAAEQDAGPSGSDYGPGYCLEARLQGDKLILDYAHITGAYPDPTQAKLDHNADLLYVEEIQEARPSHHEIQFIRTGDCEHDYTSVHVDPTCTEWGKDVYTCSKCGVSYEDIIDGRDDPLGHDWDEGEETVKPTTQAPGLMTFHCTRCDATKTKKLRRIGADIPDDVDFTTADSYDDGQYAILGPTGYEQTEDGLVIKTTRNAVEDCNGRNEGDQANTPEDMIRVPVHGDWSATLNFGFDTAGASNGYYQFFGFYAAQGEDYQNMAGIRGGDKAFQDFIRQDGAITADSDLASAPGLDTVKDYWIRIEKQGDTYTCLRSDDGEEFTEMFSYEDTGINADALLIDAYTGMTEGYTFTLKSLVFDETSNSTFRFDDVQDESKFYFDPVYWAFLANPQITKGTDDTHFGPENACTRGHVVTFLWRAAGEPEPTNTKTPFSDLKPGAFYEKAVAWAVEKGITKGQTDTTFGPDATCTRGQIVTFLWRFKNQPEPKSTKTPFSDLKSGAFYENAVAWAVEEGITKGTTETTFSPEETCTRGQVVTFLYRATRD